MGNAQQRENQRAENRAFDRQQEQRARDHQAWIESNKRRQNQVENRTEDILTCATTNVEQNLESMKRFQSSEFEPSRADQRQILVEFGGKTLDKHHEWILMYPWRKHDIVKQILSEARKELPGKINAEWGNYSFHDIDSNHRRRYNEVLRRVFMMVDIDAILRSIYYDTRYKPTAT
jgi:hypothetical protein